MTEPSDRSSQIARHEQQNTVQSNQVPMAFTIGLALFAFVLSSAAFFIPGLGLTAIEAIKTVSLHVIAMPAVFMILGWVMNRFNHHVYWRNAATLGWLLSVVWMLMKMSG